MRRGWAAAEQMFEQPNSGALTQGPLLHIPHHAPRIRFVQAKEGKPGGFNQGLKRGSGSHLDFVAGLL
jgi:hypothetical protein